MKHIYLIILSLFMLACSFKKAQANETIVLANGEWKPFVSQELDHDGLFSHIVTQAFTRQNVTVKYVFLPWKRGEQDARDGRLDGCIAYAMSDTLKTDFYYSDPIAKGTKLFFHLKKAPFDWQTMEDLAGIPVGAPIGYLYGEAFEKAETAGRLKVHRTPSATGLFRMLLAGRIKLLPLTLEVGHSLIQTELSPGQAARITYHPRPIFETTFHIILSKKKEKSQRLMKLFNRGLMEIKRDGSYDQCVKASWVGNYDKRQL